MLQYSSLCLVTIVIMAYHTGDTWMHHQWLAVLCTSLINHTTTDVTYGIAVNVPIRALDRMLCHLNTAYCFHRMYCAPWTVVNKQIMFVNGILGYYVFHVYHIGRQSHESKLWHATVHIVSTVIVLNVMAMERI